MLHNNGSQAGAGETAAPTARDDLDALPQGSVGPEAGNTITGAGTLTGATGADTVGDAPAAIVSIRGAGGQEASTSGGSLQVDGQYGVLTIDAQGSYSYVRSAGTPDGVQDVFTYTLADAGGARDTANLTILIGRDPTVEAGQLVPGTEGVVMLPAGVALSDIRVVGRDLVITMPDGSEMVIPGGAVFVPQLVIGDVEVPPANLAALLVDSEPQPAAGTPDSSGGNFAVEVGPLDPGVPLGDLIPPTELAFTDPTFEESGQFIEDEEPPTVVIVTPDNPAGATNATDSVNEAGLPTRGDEPEGSQSETDGEITSGTIVYTTPDGFESVTINGAPAVVGTVITTEFGRLTVTEINNGPDGSISYTYELLDNTSGDDTADVFEVTVTDSDGDSATATLTVDIIDDVPTARPDTDSIAAGQFGPVTGNLITDDAAGDEGDDDDGADTVGADDASVTSISGDGGSDSTFSGGVLVVEGLYGTLTVDAEGSYSYVRDADSPGGVTDVFEYTITDGDGDTSTSTLTIDIGDLIPQTGQNPSVLVDDDALPNGNPGGVGDDPDAVNVTGTLAGSGGDGALTFSLLTSGAPAGFTYVAGPNGSVLVQQGGVTVLTITVDADTGEYSVTQNAAIDHPAGGDENNLSFTINYQVEDADGDTATGSLTINVDDDTPVVGLADVAAPTLAVDETDLDADASGDFSSLFDVDFGADGAGTTSFALVVVDGTDSGLVDVATGESIFLFDNNGVIEGRVGGEEGAVAFTVSVTDSGVVTLDQLRALEHPDATDHDDPVSPDDSSIQLSVTATDADGDPVSDSVNIGGSLVFDDDGPSVSGAAAGAGVTLDETDAGSPAGFPISATSATAAITATAAFGADGAGTITYGLSLAAGADSGLQTAIGDHPITLVQVDSDTIEGRYEDGGTQVAFTIEMNADGTVTVTQEVPLEHLVDGSSAAAHDDALDLSGLVNATVTVTDRDGDTATGSAEIGGNIVFEDDGPSIDVTAASDGGVVLTTDDADTEGAASDAASSTANFSGVFALTFSGGADGAAGTPTLSYSLGAVDGSDSGLTQGGETIYLYQMADGTVVGSTAESEAAIDAANTVFDVTVDSDGVVTLTQYSQIDHPIASDPDATDAPFADHIVSLDDGLVTLTATSTVTDNDGDTDSDSATISIGSNLRFTDDGPDAQVDGQATLDTLVLDETRPVGTETDGDSDPAGLAIVTANFADNFATVDYGADGPGSTSYSLTLDGSDVPSGLYALDTSDTTDADGDGIGQGEEILLNQSGNTVTGSVGGTDYFTITIDLVTGQVTFTQLANIWHANTGSDDDTSMLDAAAGSLQVVQTVTDSDGDTDSASIDISTGVFRIEDDGPTADDEAEQNVAEGDSISGQFDFTTGTDGGSITHVNGVELVFGMDGYSQEIAVDDGTIKVKADGSYVFTADGSGSGVTSGTFTVTDGDGDTETADWSFNITDANEPTANPSTARLDDDGLAGGNPTSTAGDLDANVGEVAPVNPSEAVYHGQLSLSFGGDGAGSINFASMHGTTGMVGTETVEYSWDAATLTLTATVEGGARDGTDLFTLTLDDATSGEYTLTLLDNVLHAPGGNENDATAALTFTVLDSDGSSDSSTLTITFDDDAPTLDVTEGSDGGVVLTTDDADTEGAASDTASSTANFSGVFGLTYAAGADGAATTPTLSYTLGVSADGADSGLTQGGDTIYLYEIGGVVVGSTSDTEAGVSASNTVFDVSVDSDGVVTLTQYSQIDHPVEATTTAPFADQFVSLTDGAITLTATATITDSDGDTATDSQVASIGSNLRFTDDGPVAVDDSANQLTENSDVTVDVFANDDGGADGVDLVTGVAVVPGTLTGSGTLTYNGDGTFTYEPAANEEGTITFDYEITDFDGDTSTATVTIDLQDDSNPVPANATAAVDDEGLANGITGGDGDLVVPDNDGDDDESTFEGTLTADFGNDSPGTFDFAAMDGETGTVGTEDVEYSWDAGTNTLTATITSGARNGTDLFQVTVNPTTGVYNVTLLENVLHTYDGTNTENDATAALTFTATDSEGESANGTLTVTFDDDMPVAFDPDPISTGLENEAGSSATADLDADGDVDGNIGADLPGLISFANIVNGQDSGETSGGDAIEYWLSNDGQTLQGRTNSTDGTDGTLIFQIDLNQDHDPAGDDTYTVTMFGTIDNGAGFSFDDLTSTSAGNVEYRGVGADDPATTVDLLLSAWGADDTSATVNTDNDSIGADNQSMDAGETVRIDFISNLTSGAATPSGFNYSGHVSSNAFLGEIPQVQGSQAQEVSFTVWALDTTATAGDDVDRDPDGGFSDSTVTEINEVTVVDYLTGNTTTLDISGVADGDTVNVAYGISVTKNADGSVTFHGVQEGDSYGFRTNGDDFNAVVVEAHDSFDLGVFSIGTVDTGEPINLLLDLALTDADGDTVVVDDALDITIEPASTTTTTTTSTSSTTMLSQEPLTDSSSKLLANDNMEQQLKSMNAANMNTVFLGAVAAAGIAATPAAASGRDFQTIELVDTVDLPSLGNTVAGRALVAESVSLTASEARGSVGEELAPASNGGQANSAEGSKSLVAEDQGAQTQAPSQLSQGTDAQAQVSEAAPVADTVAMPSAEALAAAFGAAVEGGSQDTAEVSRVLADALEGGEQGQSIDAMLDALPAAEAAAEGSANGAAADVPAWDMAALAHFSPAISSYTMDPLVAQVDAPPAI